MSTLTAGFTDAPVELRDNASEDDLQIVIRAVYKQVLGNVHVLSEQAFKNAESLLRNGDITVRDFVRTVAQSELYKSLFFEGNPAYRSTELNFKHLLGRSPEDQSEIAEHVKIYNTEGYNADIDSFIDSREYTEAFGENVVPYPRTISTQTGFKNNTFNQTVSLLGGYATSDRSSEAQLVTSIASNLPQSIKVASSRGGAVTSTSKRFRIDIAGAGTTPVSKQSKTFIEVNYKQLSRNIQSIQKMGGTILGVSEVA
ncbi:phycobilisome rod-core linker polypeptide [[Limnothrix rosea] IAM M-220]|uniref:phycobilisome rod-core linker polypeptide n=1 Tax=[Limnothrix rosea] IAM M-220 TaxID=454133 RepID=UPI00095A5FE4|nr:phycobilisome rod-core linker polypeptide [[Limnothrix rosea] IAM M-220]OKH19767.1 photosystem I reaction center subunit XII [[Limnothrix rosea] IAM M-220]